MTAPETASRPRLLGKGERGESELIGNHSVRRRHSAPTRGLRAWIAGAGPLYSAVQHPAYAAPTAWDEEGWTRPYVPGPTLAERGGMEWQEACRAILPATEALHALHVASLFHGHIHPGNLLFLEGSLVLVDGGWSTRISRSCGRELPGTLGYLAPEVLLGRAIEPRTDLYSLGACLFFAMTRLLPWDAATQDALFRMHLNGRVRRLRSLVADAPVELERLIVGMLSPASSDRPRGADLVANTIRRLLGMQPNVVERAPCPLRPPLLARTNELRALRVALVDTCLREKNDAQRPLLLPGPKRIEREEKADSLEGLVGEQSISATALSVRQPMRAVVVSEEASPQQGVHLKPMNGGVLLIAGEEGTGKTRLVEEIEQFALGEGVEFVVGRCPQRPIRPLDPFAEILETLLVREPWEGPREALPPLARYAELGKPPTEFVALEAARAANFDAVARFLVDRARRAPLALCVEDLHYADGSVCALFLHLIRALRVALHEGGAAKGRPEARADLPRMFVVATYDPTAGAPRAEELLKALREIDAVQLIATMGLARVDREALYHAITGAECDSLTLDAATAAMGLDKPLFMTEFARRNSYAPCGHGQQWPSDLWSFREGVDEIRRPTLERMAVLGRPVAPGEARVDHIVWLGARRMLEPRLHPSGPTFTLAHDWSQRRAYQDCADRRLQHHAACAREGRANGAPTIEWEWHASRAGVAGAGDCRGAMQCLEVGDWELAETLFDALRQSLGGRLPLEETRWLARAQAMAGYGFQATSLIRDSGYDDARTRALLLAIQAREGPEQAQGNGSEAERESARSEELMWQGQPAEAAEAALRALRIARDTGPVQALPVVYRQMGRLYRFAAQFGAAIHCFRRAARMWRDLGQRAEYAVAVALLGEAFRAVGSVENAEKAEQEARAASPLVEDRFLRTMNTLRTIEQGGEAGPVPPVLANRLERWKAEQAARRDALTPNAVEGLAERAEGAGDVEGAWIAHAWLAEWLGQGAAAEHHRRRAAELVMAAYRALPEELKRRFLEDPLRRRIVEG